MVLLELLEVVVKGDDIMASHFLVEERGGLTHTPIQPGCIKGGV